MKRFLYSVAVVAVTMLAMTACTTNSKTTNDVNNFRIKRGTNLSHWLSQSTEQIARGMGLVDQCSPSGS